MNKIIKKYTAIRFINMDKRTFTTQLVDYGHSVYLANFTYQII